MALARSCFPSRRRGDANRLAGPRCRHASSVFVRLLGRRGSPAAVERERGAGRGRQRDLVRRADVLRDLSLTLRQTSASGYERDRDPRFEVVLANRSKTTSYPVVLPSDGSEPGWREPHAWYTLRERSGASAAERLSSEARPRGPAPLVVHERPCQPERRAHRAFAVDAVALTYFRSQTLALVEERLRRGETGGPGGTASEHRPGRDYPNRLRCDPAICSKLVPSMTRTTSQTGASCFSR